MTLSRQDLLDADNERVAGARGADGTLFALALVPGGELCVYCAGLLDPLEGLSVGDVKAALARVMVRVAEHAAAAQTYERLADGTPSKEDAVRMLEVQRFVDEARWQRPGRPGEFR